MNARAIRFLLFIFLCAAAGCATVVSPTGGKKDVTPPKLVSVDPKDSLLDTTISRIELRFDEFITVSDANKEVQVSPILPVHPTVTGAVKKVTVKLVDSLLEPNTTYRISFGNAIKDLHEGNVFKNYTYTFSTGSYFDSLQITGKVLNAATGLPDTGVDVLLYEAAASDSAIVRKKPKYIGQVGSDGSFAIKGLPDKRFKIYALKDANDNLIYDGGNELIGFTDKIIRPGDTAAAPVLLRIFKETDTTKNSVTDTTATIKTRNGRGSGKSAKEGFSYTVSLDTSDLRKRTFDITKPIEIAFTKAVGTVAQCRVTLAYDSSGVEVPVRDTIVVPDTGKVHNLVYIQTAKWLENTVYTLRLLKGFAKDTAGGDAMPSRYSFRTKRDEDYGKLQVNLPSKYYGKQFLLMVTTDKDTVYQKPVTDTIVSLTKLQPGIYSFRIIKDANENGKWDTGDLFAKLQPEEVVPYESTVKLKAGWENIIDFEPKKKAPNTNGKTKNADTSQHK